MNMFLEKGVKHTKLFGLIESLECMHTFFFTLSEDIFKKCSQCKTCNHNARLFWVVARVLLRAIVHMSLCSCQNVLKSC